LFPDTEPGASPISAAVAAEITGASERSIGRGKVVLDKGAPAHTVSESVRAAQDDSSLTRQLKGQVICP